MSDNKTPLTTLLILINDRLDRLKLNENIDSETYGFILDESDWYKQKIKDLIPVEEEAIKEFNECKEILQDLVDLQNGSPLESYRKDWEQVMQKAYSFLDKTI